jgi:hypothetical protein
MWQNDYKKILSLSNKEINNSAIEICLRYIYKSTSIVYLESQILESKIY